MSFFSDPDFQVEAEDDNRMYEESESQLVSSHQSEGDKPASDLAHPWQKVESQVVPSDCPVENRSISSSPPISSQGGNQAEVSPIDSTYCSASAGVNETQFGRLELETQQDSIRSRIGETQFANIALETQTLAPVNSLVFPYAQRDSHVIATQMPVRDPPAAPSAFNSSFLQRPEESIEDAQESFKFGHYQKPVSGQFSRMISRSNGGGASQLDPPRSSPMIPAGKLHTGLPPPQNVNQRDAEIAGTKTISTIDSRARETSYGNQARHASIDLLPARYAVKHNGAYPSAGLSRQGIQKTTIVLATVSNLLPPVRGSQAISLSQAEKHIDNANIGHNSEQTHYEDAANPLHANGERLDELVQATCKGDTDYVQQRGHLHLHQLVRDSTNPSARDAENAPLYHQPSQQLPTPGRSPSTHKIAQQQFTKSSNGINNLLREGSSKLHQSRLRRLKSRPPLIETTNGRSTAVSQNATKPLQNHKIAPFPTIKDRTNSLYLKSSNKGQSVSTTHESFELNIENGELIVPTTKTKTAYDHIEQEPLEEQYTNAALENGYPPRGESVNQARLSQQVVDTLPKALKIVKGGTAPTAAPIPHELHGGQGHLLQQKDRFSRGYHPIAIAELSEPSDHTTPVCSIAQPQNSPEPLREDFLVPYRESSQPMLRNISGGNAQTGSQTLYRNRSQPRQPISTTSPQTPPVYDGKISKSKKLPTSTLNSLFGDSIDVLGSRLQARQLRNESDIEFWSTIKDASNRAHDMIEQQKLQIGNLTGERLNDEKLRKALEEQIATLNKENDVYHKQVSALKKKSHYYSTHMNLALKDRDRVAEIGKEREDRTRAAIEDCEAAQKIGAAQSQLVKEQEDKRASLEKRVKEVIRYSSENLQALTIENKSLTATIGLLKTDLERQVLELGREKNLSKMLHDQLMGRKAEHEELVGLLTKAQTDTIEELTKEDGVLVNILNTGRHVQPKIDELLSLIKDLKSTEPYLPATLVKLLEDSFLRFNDKIPNLEVASASQDSQAKLLGDLKEGLDQLRLDNEERARLKDNIIELQEAKAALESNIATRESELDGLKARIGSLDTDLASRSNELGEKKRELEAALARAQEDPHLNAQLQEFQRANTSLQDQLDAASRDVSQVNEELRLLQETSQAAQEQLKDARGKLGEANSKIQRLAEDRKKYTETNKKKHEKEIQELAKSAKSQKDEAQRRYDAMVKTANQQRADLELQLTATRESLKKKQAELSKLESYGTIVNNLRSEMNSCREQLLQQTQGIIYLEEQCTIRAERDKEIETSRQKLFNENIELKRLVDNCNSTAVRNFEQGQRERRQIEDELRHVESLKKEKDEIEQNSITIQECLDFMNNTVAQSLKTTGTLRKGQTIAEWAAALPKPPPKRKASQISSNEEETATGQRSSNFSTHASRSTAKSTTAPVSLGQSQKSHKKGRTELAATILSHATQDQIASPQGSSHRVAKPRGGTQINPSELDQVILRTETETSYHSRTTTYQETREAVQFEENDTITPSIRPFYTMMPIAVTPEQSEFSRGEATQKGSGRSPGSKSNRRKSGTTRKSFSFRITGVAADSQEGDSNMTIVPSQKRSASNREEARQKRQLVPKKSALKLQHDPNKTPKKAVFCKPLTKSPAHPKVSERSSAQDTTQVASKGIMNGGSSSYNGAKFGSKTGGSRPKIQDQQVEQNQLPSQRQEDSPFLGKRFLQRNKSNTRAGRIQPQSKRRVSVQPEFQHATGISTQQPAPTRTEIPDSQENLFH